MPDVQHLEIELQYLRDGLEQLIDACGHYTPPGGEP